MSDFYPVDPDAYDPLPYPELNRRVTEALAKVHDEHWNLLNSENNNQWSPMGVRKATRETRQRVIREFNEEMANK